MNQAAPFWNRVRHEGACWVWTGAIGANGYGRITVAKTPRDAHRVAYELAVGPIPDGMLVCHRCDNPPCVRPDHLFLGNKSDNARDMVAKGRSPYATRTHCPAGHEYSAANTYVLTKNGRTRRTCRTCNREIVRRRRSCA